MEMNNCCSCDPQTDCRFAGDIAEYIADEMRDSRYYTILSAMAPTERGRDLLLEFSQDEWSHAQRLMRAYTMLTGRVYTPPMVEDPLVPEYYEALKVRILAETADYKKYGVKYLAACNPCLKDMFFMFRTDEAIHAMRMQILLAGG
jgi:rubrerythrin